MAVVSDGEEAVARAQFKKLGWGEELFELIVGADSGARAGSASAMPTSEGRTQPRWRTCCRPREEEEEEEERLHALESGLRQGRWQCR